MDYLGKVYYKYQKKEDNIIKVQNGITYYEIPSPFRRKTKEVRIIFKENRKDDKNER